MRSSSPTTRPPLAAVAAALACAWLALPASADAKIRELRVCADPGNLPYSAKDGAGFENRIAALLADEIGVELSYYWYPQRRSFLRDTLNKGYCDVVMGVPAATRTLETTRAYYRSSYAFVQREGEAPIKSFSDPALKHLRIGVQLLGEDGVNTPPVHDLASRGIVDNVHGYMIYGDNAGEHPASPIIDAVADGEVDVAIVWGPIAGYFAAREDEPLTVTPVLFDPDHMIMQMTYDIAIGTRKGDTELAAALEKALRDRRPEVDAILAEYGVPRADRPTRIGDAK